MSSTGGYGNGFWDAFQPEARISARSFAKGDQPIGTEERLIFLRPRDDDDDPDIPGPDEDPPEPGDPCAGQPLVRSPLVAAQIDLSFGSTVPRPCPSDADRDSIIGAVRTQFRNIISDADVRIDCRANILTIAIWEASNGNPCELQARFRGLERLDLLEGNEAFGFMLKAGLLTVQAARGFALAPKRLSGNGTPRPGGPIHLTGLSVRFVPPNAVVTRVEGFDDRPLPDVPFTLTITDTIDQRAIIEETTRDLDTHGAWKAVLSALFLGGVVLSPLVLPVALWVIAGDLAAAFSDHDSGGEAGVGERALGLVPTEISLPGGRKLTVFYSRSDVTLGGLFFGGAMVEVDRQPAASMAGPSSLVVAETAPGVGAVFRLAVADTFGTVSVKWQPVTGVTIERPTSRETRVVFTRTQTEGRFTRTLRAKVSDQDGFVAELSKTVEIVVVETGLPAICQTHPTLPECRPDSPV
jgi:hypothetical protein